ncbi:MAG: HDIG domain-containing protein [Thermoanaerobacteraceae bacterium]|nr:HDIG domain-containing protein [Thermoanaerobacteraceae bacterium]
MIRLYRHITARRVIWGAVFFILTALILGINYVPEKVSLEEGQPSPKNFIAPKSIVFQSQVLTEKAREEAADQVTRDYRVDKTVLEEIDATIDEVFNNLIRAKRETLQEGAAAVPRQKLQAVMGFEISDQIARAVNENSEDTLEEVAGKLKSIVHRYMADGIQQEAIPATRDKIMQAVHELSIDKNLQVLAAAIVEHLELRANLIYDHESTMKKRAEARKNVAPVVVTIRKNQKIVGKGDIVKAEDIEALQHLGLLRTKSPYSSLAGLMLFILVIYGLVGIYLFIYRREIYDTDRYFNLLGLLIVTVLLIGRAVTSISITDRAEIAVLVGYLVPVAAGSMLISILLDNKLAIFITVVMSIFVGMIIGGEMQYAVVAFIGGIVSVFSVSKLSQRSDLAKASIYIMIANVLAIISFGLINKSSVLALSVGSALGAANGILSSVLTIGLLPFLESVFGITTSVRLLELSNPNHPLLKRLLLEAPGTYHHAILVGNMAEAAADAVGADSLLARVGAYYHDIGKLKRPYFFIENQLTPDNPHDKLAPTLSTLIITSHIKDGVELAQQYGLPDVIRDIIEQHHGTSLITYFYHKACKDCEGEEENTVSQEDFRYETPKPKTKEAAIVMLADSVEAGVRAMQKPNPGRIEGFVRKVIKEKLEDGQLEECDLTFRELDIIAHSFVQILNGIFHSRVEYPDSVLKEMERRNSKDGGQHSQSAG